MINKWIGIGRVVSDPEVRYTASGDAWTRVSIACDESWKNKEGVKQTNTEFINIIFWKKLAEIVGKFVKKGKLIYVEGKIKSREWEDQSKIKHKIMEVHAFEMRMLSPKETDDHQKTENLNDIAF